MERLILLRSRSAMRTAVLILASTLMLLGLDGCSKRPGPVESAQHFFELIGSGQMDAAYKAASFSFQAQHSSLGFAAVARDMRLTSYAGGDWGQPEREGNSAKMALTIHTREGEQIPLIVTVVQENGAWRVFSLRSPPAPDTGVSENKFSLVGKVPSIVDEVVKPLPKGTELKEMVRDNLVRFNEAIGTKSFDEFYDSVASKWQENGLTKGKLQRAFQPFIDNKIDLGEVQRLEPKFTSPPLIDSEGVLSIAGEYRLTNFRVVFSMRFYFEPPTWKLFGLDVNIVD